MHALEYPCADLGSTETEILKEPLMIECALCGLHSLLGPEARCLRAGDSLALCVLYLEAGRKKAAITDRRIQCPCRTDEWVFWREDPPLLSSG